jgi:hypothetical protein
MKKADRKTPYLYEHEGVYWYRRSIPKDLRRFTGGVAEFKRSLQTRIWEDALLAYFSKKSEYEIYIQNCMDGHPIKDFEYYQNKAISKGLENEGLRFLLKNAKKTIYYHSQYKKIKNNGDKKDEFLTLFNARESDLILSKLIQYYIEKQKYDLDELNSAELRKKRNWWRRSINVLMDFLKKDKRIVDITKDDARKFEEYIREKLNNRVIGTNTANRYLMNIRTLFSMYL